MGVTFAFKTNCFYHQSNKKIMFRKFIFCFTVITLFIVVSCNKPEQPNTLKKEHIISFGNCTPTLQSDEICFDSLVQDSRCPTNLQCPWTGIGIVRLKLTNNGSGFYFNLGTLKNSNRPFPPNDTIINGMHIELLELLPYPVSINTNPSVYQVKLAVYQ
jgi:hypothetical protein